MSVLNPDKLHVACAAGISETDLVHPRRYTLTHSDRTGELFLTIAHNYDREQISDWYTRLMRESELLVHFRAKQRRYNRVESWGTIGEYALKTISAEA